jgi:hypothetical protein
MPRSIFPLLLALGGVLLSQSGEASAQFTCGGRTVSVFNSDIPESPFFVLNIGGMHYLPFSVENEYFAVRCETDLNRLDRILILHTCGGSGCADNANFGIVDPRTGRLLLRPNARYRGNSNKAEAILGKKIRPFACDRHSKTSVADSQKGAYCFMSPLELS